MIYLIEKEKQEQRKNKKKKKEEIGAKHLKIIQQVLLILLN